MNTLPTLVAQAAQGDQDAWTELVRRYHPMLRSIARTLRLTEDEAADASQTTWLMLTRHIGRIREPERMGGWLSTTMRHECLRVLGRRTLEDLVDDWSAVRLPAAGGLDAHVVRAERDQLVREAVDDLPGHQRKLMLVLSQASEPSYQQVAEVMSMPVGSIGPTRARALRRLRGLLEGRGVDSDALDLTA